MYAKALDRLWRVIWVDLRFFGLRTLGDNERHRGWTTWAFWVAFWLLFPIILFCFLGIAVAQVLSSLFWGPATFILLFFFHGLAIWGRLKKATAAIFHNPVQASWISPTLASLALFSFCLIGVAVVSFASFSAGMSVSLFEPSGGNELRTTDDPGARKNLSNVKKEPTAPQTVTASEVHTKNNLPVWWRRGDASMPVVGFDATLVTDNPPWDHSALCRHGVLVIFSRSSNDGPSELNKKLSRKRAETLLSILSRLLESCATDQQPHLLAVSLGHSIDSWHDGSQRVVKLGLIPGQSSAADHAEIDRQTLSAIGDSFQLSLSRYESVEVCLHHQESGCEWSEVLGSP